MAGNPYIPDDDVIPTSEAAGAVSGAAQAALAASPAAAMPTAEATRAQPGAGLSVAVAPGANPYLPEGVQLPGSQLFEEKYTPDGGVEPFGESLPDLWSAPAASPLKSMAGFTAFATNSGADQVEKILKANNPGTVVEAKDGYRIYSFPGDPQKYAWKPGARLSDVARAVPGVLGSAAAVAAAPSAAVSIPAAIVANVVQSLLGETAKAKMGGDFEKGNVLMSAAIPPVFAGIKGTAGLVGRGIGKILTRVGQKADTLVDPLVQKAEDVLVSLGAKRDLSGLAHEVAGTTGPAVDAAKAAASQAAANTETVAATAAAKAEAETAKAAIASDAAIGTARTTAQDALNTTTNTLQDDVAAAAAKSEAAQAAAQAPVDSVVEGTRQALQALGAGETSSLNKKFLKFSMGVLDDLEKKAAALYEKIEKGFPKEARIQPGKAFQELQEWLDKKLVGRSPPKLLAKIKADTGLEEVGNAVRMPQVVDITRAKQLASAVGHGGISEYADLSKGDAKFVAGLLEKVQDQAARDHGMGKLLDDAQAAWAKRQAYRGELKKVLALQGEKTLRKGTLAPALRAAGTRALNGDLLKLEQIMASAPPGMKQELMADIVGRMVDPSQGPEHVVAAIKAIAKSPEANELVFKNLAPGARKQLLGLGADMERALTKRGQDIAAAKAAQEAETEALKRGATLAKQGIQNTERAEIDAARATAAAAADKIAKDKAATVSTAKLSEQAANEALKEAERLHISMASEIKKAGTALLNGDTRPYQEMLKSAPGKKKALSASTLFHALFDPTDNGPEALARIADGLARLKANPTARKLLLSSHGPNALADIGALGELAKRVYSGTGGGERVLNALGSMGAWAGGRTGGTAANVGTNLAGGGAVATPVVGLFGTLLGRILTSKFARDSTVETKAANAFLASETGKALLRHANLDKPVAQNVLVRLGGDKAVKAAARVYGMTPVRFLRKLTEHGLREGAEQGLSPNNTKEEE